MQNKLQLRNLALEDLVNDFTRIIKKAETLQAYDTRLLRKRLGLLNSQTGGAVTVAQNHMMTIVAKQKAAEISKWLDSLNSEITKVINDFGTIQEKQEKNIQETLGALSTFKTTKIASLGNTISENQEAILLRLLTGVRELLNNEGVTSEQMKQIIDEHLQEMQTYNGAPEPVQVSKHDILSLLDFYLLDSVNSELLTKFYTLLGFSKNEEQIIENLKSLGIDVSTEDLRNRIFAHITVPGAKQVMRPEMIQQPEQPIKQTSRQSDQVNQANKPAKPVTRPTRARSPLRPDQNKQALQRPSVVASSKVNNKQGSKVGAPPSPVRRRQ